MTNHFQNVGDVLLRLVDVGSGAGSVSQRDMMQENVISPDT